LLYDNHGLPAFYIAKNPALVVKFRIQPSDSLSRQTFPRKIGQKVRGVSETHE